jgi:hypothetical protein
MWLSSIAALLASFLKFFLDFVPKETMVRLA